MIIYGLPRLPPKNKKKSKKKPTKPNKKARKEHKPQRQSKKKKRGKVNYFEHIKSDYWKEVRAIILERDGKSCRACGRTFGLHVHHSSYEHLGCEKEYLDDLVTLCSECHHFIYVNKYK